MIDKIIERLRNTTYPCFDNYGLGFNRGVREAIDIVKQVAAEGGWIKCSDRLPENQVRVLVKTDKTPLVVGWLMFDEWYTDFGHGYGKLDVIAWQPLPKPFKESD